MLLKSLDPRLLSIGGAGLGQIFMFAAMALVSRVYPANALNQYGIFFSLFNIIQISASLRLEQGLVYESEPDRVRALFSACCLVIAPVTFICSLISLFYLARNPDTAHSSAALSILLFCVVCFSGPSRVYSQYIARSDAFAVLAVLNFLRPTFIAICQVAGILFGAGLLALPIALLVSQIALFFASRFLIHRCVAGGLPTFSLTGTWEAAESHKAFVLFSLPQNLVFVVSESVVPLSLSFLFPGAGSVALFWLASRAVFAPATVVAESIRPMIYRSIGNSGGNLRRTVIKTLGGLAAISAVPVIIIALFGDVLFGLVFGPRWASASDYALVLAVLVGFNMCSIPIVGSLPVIRLQHGLLIAEICGLLVRISLIFMFHWASAISVIMATTAIYIAVIGGFYIFAMVRIMRHHPRSGPTEMLAWDSE